MLLPAASPPSEYPTHQAEAGPAHQNRAYEFVGCPMKAAAADNSDIDPANMVSAAWLVCWTTTRTSVPKLPHCWRLRLRLAAGILFTLASLCRCLLQTRCRRRTNPLTCPPAERSPPSPVTTPKRTGCTRRSRCSGTPCCGRGGSKLFRPRQPAQNLQGYSGAFKKTTRAVSVLNELLLSAAGGAGETMSSLPTT